MPRDDLMLISEKKTSAPKTVFFPFDSVEQAWFWFMQGYEARTMGARIKAGATDKPRPCEPLDILRVVDRLYRERRLMRDHLKILAHYGRRLMPPDPARSKELRAHYLWQEAMLRMDAILRFKGIVQ
jgi:hypothetical protein